MMVIKEEDGGEIREIYVLEKMETRGDVCVRNDSNGGRKTRGMMFWERG